MTARKKSKSKPNIFIQPKADVPEGPSMGKEDFIAYIAAANTAEEVRLLGLMAIEIGYATDGRMFDRLRARLAELAPQPLELVR